MSSDAGLTLLREVERRHDLAGLLASCLDDPRDPSKILHSLEDIIRFRIMMIAAGYEDGNDAADLRHEASVTQASIAVARKLALLMRTHGYQISHQQAQPDQAQLRRRVPLENFHPPRSFPILTYTVSTRQENG
jgi:hypothetical protein